MKKTFEIEFPTFGDDQKTFTADLVQTCLIRSCPGVPPHLIKVTEVKGSEEVGNLTAQSRLSSEVKDDGQN